MTQHDHLIYLLTRCEMHLAELVILARGKPPPPPPKGEGSTLPSITFADGVKLAIAAILVWSALTGKLEPSALVGILVAR